MNDYYVDDRGLAMFFETHWLDVLRDHGNQSVLESKSRHVSDRFIISNHFNEVAQSINNSLLINNIHPQKLLEVGSSLGRSSYEMIKAHGGIKNVTAVEPSQAFMKTYKDILLKGHKIDFTYIKSRQQLGHITFDSSPIAKVCADVKFELINKEFDSHTVDEQFDLVVSLNVLDQCPSPNTIVNALKHSVKVGGVLCLSCTYQWNKKHLLDSSEAVNDINDYFEENQWKCLSQHEHDYKFRFSERFSRLFSAHLVVYQKLDV